MKGLPQGRKYLGTIVSRSAPKKADQLFSHGSPGEVNFNFSAHQLCSADGQANSQADGQGYYQAKARPAELKNELGIQFIQVPVTINPLYVRS